MLRIVGLVTLIVTLLIPRFIEGLLLRAIVTLIHTIPFLVLIDGFDDPIPGIEIAPESAAESCRAIVNAIVAIPLFSAIVIRSYFSDSPRIEAQIGIGHILVRYVAVPLSSPSLSPRVANDEGVRSVAVANR